MGYYGDIGREAGERAKERISKGEKPSTVHKQELGGAVAKAVVATGITIAAPIIIPVVAGKILWDKLRGK
ncbi:MAG: hypothetical protein EYC62_07615 [Alphaproteobacteria bacterium]|nr:MAG: hypothetical protein EYC62_07615 [Alphaproteobacteria bacterium]